MAVVMAAAARTVTVIADSPPPAVRHALRCTARPGAHGESTARH